MKKIMKVVSLILTFAILASMVIVPSSTAFADSVYTPEPATKGTITIKPQSSKDGATLKNASFVAYRILTIIGADGTGKSDSYRFPFTDDENGLDSSDSNNYKIRQDLINAINDGHPLDSSTSSMRLEADANLMEIVTHLRAHGAKGTEIDSEGNVPPNATIEGFAEAMYKRISGTGRPVGEADHTSIYSTAAPTGIKYTSTASGNNQVFSDLPYGYYLIYNTSAGTYGATSAIILLNNDTPGGEEIYVKATVPTLDKKIIEEVSGESTTESTANSGSVGDPVKFQLKTILPNATGYNEDDDTVGAKTDDNFVYVITDKLSAGLTLDPSQFNVDDITIKIGTEEGGYHTIKATSNTTYVNVTVTPLTEDEDAPNGTKLTIDLAPIAVAVAKGKFATSVWTDSSSYLPKVGDDIIVEYTAKINDKAVIKDPNTNKATLEYSNNPNDSESKETTEPEPGTTNTYTFGLKINKQDSGQETTKIKGAQFTIKNSKGEYAQVSGYTGESKLAESKGDAFTISSWVAEETNATYFVTDDKGEVQINGLGEGDYTLMEMNDPKVESTQYYRIDKEIKFTISATYKNGAVDTLNYTLDKAYNGVRGSAENTNFNNYGVNTASANGYAIIPVLNSQREPLPETGGMGTTLLYVVGGALIVIAGVLLISKRRMHAAR